MCYLPFFSEFCNHKNEGLDISPEEVPTGDSFDFVLIPARKEEDTKEAAEGDTEKELTPEKKEESKGMVVYCIDISGSMNCNVKLPDLQGILSCFCFYHTPNIFVFKRTCLFCVKPF